MGHLGIDDLEDLSSARADEAARAELLARQTECTFVFSARGWPTGVVMSYLWDGAAFWLTAVESRRHVRALGEDDRVTLVITNAGTGLPGRQMLSIQGRAVVHRDEPTITGFLDRFSAHLTGAAKDSFVRLLGSPGRVVIEVVPQRTYASHDSRRMAGDGRGGPAGQPNPHDNGPPADPQQD